MKLSEQDAQAIERLRSNADFRRFLALLEQERDAAARAAAIATEDVDVRRSQGAYRLVNDLLTTIETSGASVAPRTTRRFTA